MSDQQFERLIRLEDEELDDSIEKPHSDSCRVPFIATGSPADREKNLENLFFETKHKQAKIGDVHFTISGRHIHINPEQLKYISLITLTIQNAALNLTMRAARTQSEQFSTPAAVTVAEFLKFFTCVILVLFEESSVIGGIKTIKDSIITNYIDTLKVAVPSFVYYVQNNLIYVGSTHLDAATSQVTYQLKILTTALFSVLMLNKKLSRTQWIALFLLFVGVAMIETVAVADKESDRTGEFNQTSHHIETRQDKKDKPLLGFLAILVACCLSGFAGVYFEKILKNTTHVSLWIRNIQLAVVAIPIGLMQVLFFDEGVAKNGVFYGFTPLTWLCILLTAQGGLLVAVVVKFANNILKGFATSLSIVISTVASVFLFEFNLTPTFILGASIVIGSVMIYNKQ